ncbi:MAG: hypothetical protein OHK0039_04490 [Bacteroidia bacterium]
MAKNTNIYKSEGYEDLHIVGIHARRGDLPLIYHLLEIFVFVRDKLAICLAWSESEPLPDTQEIYPDRGWRHETVTDQVAMRAATVYLVHGQPQITRNEAGQLHIGHGLAPAIGQQPLYLGPGAGMEHLYLPRKRPLDELVDASYTLDSYLWALQLLDEGLPVGFMLQDARGRLVWTNRRMAELLGSPDTPPSMDVLWEQMHPDDVRKVQEALEKVVQARRTWQGVFRLGQDDHQRWIQTRVRWLPHLEGDAACVLISCEDITGSRLRREEIQRILDSDTHLMGVLDRAGNLVEVNRLWQPLLGYSRDALLGSAWLSLVCGGDEAQGRAFLAQLQQGQAAAGIRIRNQHADGSARWFAWEGVPDSDLQVIFLTGRDIGRQRQEEDYLRLIESAVSHASEGIVIAEASGDEAEPFGRIVFSNEAFERITGYPSDSWPHQTLHALVGPETDQELLRRLSLKLKLAERYTGDLNIYHLQGHQIWVYLSIVPLFDDASRHTHWLGIVRDISEERRNQRLVRQSEANLSALINSTEDIILSVDRNYRLLTCNSAYQQIMRERYGVEVAIGGYVFDWLDRERSQAWRQRFAPAMEGHTHTDILEEDVRGKRIYHSLSFSPIFDGGQVIGCTLFSRDITPVKEAEEALRFQADILANVHDSVIATDLAGKVTYFNRGATEIFGYQAEEIIGHSLRVLYPGMEDRQIRRNLLQILDGRDYSGEWRGRHKNGRDIWLDVRTTLLRASDGSAKGFIGVAKDVTSKVETQRELSRNESYLRAMMDASGSYFILLDPNARILIMNRESKELLKRLLNIDVEVGDTLSRMVSLRHRRILLSTMSQVLWGKSINHILPLADSTGQQYWFEYHMAPVVNNQGDNFAISLHARDITELYMTRQHVIEQGERLQLASEAAGIGVWDWNLDTGQFIWDARMRELFGVDKDPTTPTFEMWRSTLHPDDRSKAEQEMRDAIIGLHRFDTSYRVLLPDGNIRYIQSFANVHRNAEGKPIRMIGVNWDATRARQAQEEMRKAKELAEEMSRMKSTFLANMSHEIRTPLNGILGLADIMVEVESLDTVREYAQKMKKSGMRLLYTLTGVLELARIEAGQTESALQLIDINHTLRDICQALDSIAQQKKLAFAFDPASSDSQVVGDERMFTHVFNNLIGNALKFTEAGSVQVSARRYTDTRHRRDWIEVSVRDTGVGISPENLEKIFQPFKQESEGWKRKYQGSGLGLSIAKKYTQLLGGTIDVQSEKGKGSIFTVKLPAYHPKENHETDPLR